MRTQPARIERYSALDGTLLDAAYVDIDGLLGFNGTLQNVWDLVVAPNGELWVSNFTAQRVHRFTGDGDSYLGDVPLTVGIVLGLAVDGSRFWFATFGGSLAGGAYSYDAAYTKTAFYSGSDIIDVHWFAGDILLCRANGAVERIDSATGAEIVFSVPGGSCAQAFTRANGGLLVANAANAGYCALDANGVLVATHFSLATGSVNGVAELVDGRVLLSCADGVYVHDPVTGGLVQRSTGAGTFIGVRRGAFVSTSTCTSTPSSTGAVAILSGEGSNRIADDDLRLVAALLPSNSFAYFLTSRAAGSVANPGGSAGVLCLGGSIGRYVGPGQIMHSGALGTIALRLELTSMPQRTGPVAMVAGETWHFQAWFRDAVGGSVTSNFTSGMSALFH